MFRVRRGLDLPIQGVPTGALEDARIVSRVALVGADYHGLKPRLLVETGTEVQQGQPVFECRKTGVIHTAPAAGTIESIHRGERRVFQSLVIRINENEPAAAIEGDDAKTLMLNSGLWAALRSRPFGSTPAPDASAPHSIFVQATDSHPLAPRIEYILDGRIEDLEAGLTGLTSLTKGKVFYCVGPDTKAPDVTGVSTERFSGPHPAGCSGVHIHLLDPVYRDKVVWQIGIQDVLALGHLIRTKTLDTSRIVSIGGPMVETPKLVRTRMGAELGPLLEGLLKDGAHRVISGSVLGGRKAEGEPFGFLGRYHQSIAVLQESDERTFLDWVRPGFGQFSLLRVFARSLLPKRPYAFTSSANGSKRAIVPVGAYERVMPMDILPTLLCRALLSGDAEQAEALGCLELLEEDVALLSFVCPGKNDYGPALRGVLNQIEESME